MIVELPPDFADLLVALVEAGAEFLVVGGYAVAHYGDPRASKHIDVFVRAGRANAERVVEALTSFGAPLWALGIGVDDFERVGYHRRMGEPAPRLTYDEYLALEANSEERLEYVDGFVYAMAGGTPEHARLAMTVGVQLSLALQPKGCAVYSSDLKLRIEATGRSTYADIAVVCGDERHSELDPNAVTNPTIIVEVLSPSTEAADRGEKWRHYQRLASLREYVLVSQGEPYVEVFRREGDEWILRTSVAGGVVELPSQGASIAVDAIYADPRSS